MERGWKPNVEISPNCPRCGSCNTKFCYYNNYSLTQPRYFCKGCRRYWTKGGSLRNVPLGGGCRKSRRGKSIRISTDRVLSRGGLAYGNPSVEPASSSMVPDGSNIDIAQVYANFLNRPPEPETRPELPSDSDLSFQFASVSNFNTHLQLENGHFECASLSDRFSETQPSDGGAIYGCGFDSIHEQQEIIQQFTTDHVITNYGLPPLPGEEEAPEDMGWSSSQMMVPNHILHMPQLPGIEREPQHPVPDQVIGNKISSSYGTFFGP